MRNFIDLLESSLAMDTASRMQRAKELGFNVRAYHGTGAKFNEFDLDKGKPSMLSGYAPHFASKKEEAKGYADERKQQGESAKVLDCLLRIKKPFKINYDKPISKSEYKKITGGLKRQYNDQVDKDTCTTYDALRYLTYKYGYERDKYEDRRKMWTLIYHHLMELGYDSLVFENTPSDYGNGYYHKIIVFDPKNIRSVKAKFDPSQSDSSKIMS